MDIDNIPIYDFHAHIPGPNNVSKVVEILFNRWLKTAVSQEIYDKYNLLNEQRSSDKLNYTPNEIVQLENKYGIDKLKKKFTSQLITIPSFQYFLRYLSKIYSCNPDIKSIDEELSEKLTNKINYMEEVLERENIQMVILDLFGKMEIRNFPIEKAQWIYRIDKLLQPSFIIDNGIKSINQLSEIIIDTLSDANKKGCVGFKSAMTYNRDLNIIKTSKIKASNVFNKLLDLKQDEKNLRIHQDYLLKIILKGIEELDKPFLLHYGVGGPGPKPDLRNIDPDKLRNILDNPDLTDLKLVLLHCSYPYCKKAAVMAYQYSNLYIDLSIPTFFHGNLEDTLTTFLEFTPHQKLFYGSDAWHTPDLFGYDAFFFKKALKITLEKLALRYEMTTDDLETVAKMILYQNTVEFLDI